MIRTALSVILLFASSLFGGNANIHHELKVQIIPSDSKIEVVDDILIKKEILTESVVFKMNAALELELLTDNISLEITKKSVPAEDIGMDRDDSETPSKLLVNEYTLTGFSAEEDLNIAVKYSGLIDSPVEQSEENYQRGFSESPGIISDLGIYLAGSTYWVPTFGDEFVTFNLTTELPGIWRTVSQGKRILDEIENEIHTDTWSSNTPQEEIYLIGAKFNEYKFSTGTVDAYAFLRTPDEALANKYLETTAQYLEMYRKLVGPFPYTKFALVENFWETGYGMPSFTLLGEKIIRFPFILHSSYPHELLHNWWGNSVYVDFESGNWCEGLTAYMADHLIKEQRGQAVEYRRSTLQKYSDFVNSENEFPLTGFRSRYDGVSEAIGYGKSLMFFHMLRYMVGDDIFIKALQVFNRENKFKKAAYQDIQKSFEEETGEDLTWFFDQWVKRKGAPQLELSNVSFEQLNESYKISFEIEQVQKSDVFVLDIPITIVSENNSFNEKIRLSKKSDKFSFSIKEKPVKILIDPQFDVMRRLDSREIPPAFTKAYGSDNTLIVMPDTGSQNFESYSEFVNGWIKGKEEKFEILSESEIDKLPADKTVWILGNSNSKLPLVKNALDLYSSFIRSDSISFLNKAFSTNNNCFFAATANPENIEEVVLFLTIGNEKAVPGLLRKLPHYGKYSYLVFEGEEPTNIEKGQWPVINSPLIKLLDPDLINVNAKFEKRKALAELAPAFSASRMMQHIEYLASPEMKGRGLGTEELNSAADYIAGKFEEYGLIPAGDKQSYFQTFEHNFGAGRNYTIINILGMIPGTDKNLTEPVVISAHYDHLGLGWPDVRKGNEGKIHYGADDNASGVAVLLELAKSLGKSFKPSRTLIFAAFSGEEAGLLGSQYFVKNYASPTGQKILANLNFDTVGRLFKNKMMILNSNSAREWKFIFMGTEYTTGIPSELITQELDASDQVSFIKNGIPAVQFFSGPNEDYHKPEDTAEKIDSEGLVKFAAVGKEIIQYLTERKDLMNFTGSSGESKEESSQAGGKEEKRRVSTGTMPDFSYSGEGVKVAAISEDSPGEKAGMLKGDIIKKFDGKPVKSLKEYSNLLKEHAPGDKVLIEIEREGKILNLEIELSER